SALEIPHAELRARVVHGRPHIAGVVLSDSEQLRMLEGREVLHRLSSWFPTIEVFRGDPQISRRVFRQSDAEPRGKALRGSIAAQAGISGLADRTFALWNSVAAYPNLS